MTKYMCIRKLDFTPTPYNVGDVVEIEKLNEPITETYEFGDFTLTGTSHYQITDNGFKLQDNQLKYFFRPIQAKISLPKRLLYIISLLTVYELSKYITNEIIIRSTASDEIDAPCDYDINSHEDLNDVHNYNAGGN